ncbi:hypothetical protein ACOMHN_020314 [Nucella lapillus]
MSYQGCDDYPVFSYKTSRPASRASGYLPDTADDKVRKLDAEKQSLTLQVNVLSEQLEAQGEKIADLELHVTDREHRLTQAQDILQAELVSRNTLESGKVDLMNEVTALSVKVTDLHNHTRDLEQRYRAAQRQLAEQEAKLLIRDAELAEMRQRFKRDGSHGMNDPGDTDVERLRRAVDTLMFSNDDKDRRIEELRRAVKRYRRLEEILTHTKGKAALEELLQNAEEDSNNSPTSSNPLPFPLHTPVREGSQVTDLQRNGFALPGFNGTPDHSPEGRHRASSGNHNDGAQSMKSPRPTHTEDLQRSNSCENINVNVQLASPDGQGGKRSAQKGSRRHGMLGQHTSGSFSASTSPCRKEEATSSIKRSVSMHSPSSSCTPRRRSGISVLTRAFFRLRSAGKHSQSAPNLVGEDGEVVRDAGDGLQETEEGEGGGSPHQPDHKKNRRLKQLFSKLKRSSSQNFDGGRDRLKGREFQRGCARATAVAHLADWSPRSLRAEREVGFAGWDGERVTSWMMSLDLTMYLSDCRRWVTTGQQLIQATSHDLEKELGMKNAFHRKKLHLALQAQISGDEDAHLADVDHNVVARWLDDIGLPQYKDAFYDARVDGRMLHHLTVDDLLALKVTNELHHLSIKRGIQVLRLCGFHLNTLLRRPLPHEQNRLLEDEPGQVMLWTSHRVMEWLRTIDLSEYAPNLRGSGVHGALMVLEPRFNADLMAVLLSIPAHKTLLRRHLSLHFVSLIGPHTQARKRQFESSPDYQPLIMNAKVRDDARPAQQTGTVSRDGAEWTNSEAERR